MSDAYEQLKTLRALERNLVMKYYRSPAGSQTRINLLAEINSLKPEKEKWLKALTKKAGWQLDIYKELKPQILKALNLRKLKDTKAFQFTGDLTSFDQTKFHNSVTNNWNEVGNIEKLIDQGRYPLWKYLNKLDGPIPNKFDKHFSTAFTGSQRTLRKQQYKKADFLQDTKDYLTSAYDYNKYLLKHKWNVYRAGSQLDLPFIQLAVHDYNKFVPSRWDAYRKWMNTSEGRNGIRDPKVFKRFRRLADQHIESVPYGHHWYRSHTPVDKVPVEYRLEALADWWGVYRSQANIKNPLSFPDWYKKHRDTLPLDPVAKGIADQKLLYSL